MTTRRVPEWVGATPDTRVPDRVRVRVFEGFRKLVETTGAREPTEAGQGLIPIPAGYAEQ